MSKNIRLFHREFVALCKRTGIFAAYYLPTWSDDEENLIGFQSGGDKDACIAMDLLLEAGAKKLGEDLRE